MNLPINYDEETKALIKERMSAVSKKVVDIKTTADEYGIRLIKKQLAEQMSLLEREDRIYPMMAEDFDVKIEFTFPNNKCTIIPANARTYEFFEALSQRG